MGDKWKHPGEGEEHAELFLGYEKERTYLTNVKFTGMLILFFFKFQLLHTILETSTPFIMYNWDFFLKIIQFKLAFSKHNSIALSYSPLKCFHSGRLPALQKSPQTNHLGITTS